MKDLKFEDLPKSMELALQKIFLIEEKLSRIEQNFQPKVPDELMTRNETAKYLKINLTTLWNWTKKGRINAYGIGARVYYKRGEIEHRLIKIN